MIAPKRGTVIIQYDEKDYPGDYGFSKGLLTVNYEDEYKNAFLHPASDPEPMARLMLTDIIEKVLRKQVITSPTLINSLSSISIPSNIWAKQFVFKHDSNFFLKSQILEIPPLYRLSKVNPQKR